MHTSYQIQLQSSIVSITVKFKRWFDRKQVLQQTQVWMIIRRVQKQVMSLFWSKRDIRSIAANSQKRFFSFCGGLMFTCGRSALSPLDKKLIDHLQRKKATQLIPKQMWWALSMDHPLWIFWCAETCWCTVSSFSNKAVFSCQCAFSWRRSKLAEINSACQGRGPEA